MKITKSQLREIIREEISKLNQPKMSTRLKELISKGWVLSEDESGNQTVKNPETGRTIKVKTALSYPQDHPAHQAARKAQGGTSSTKSPATPDIPINDKAWSMEKDEDDYGNPVFSMNDSAVADMESVLNKITGGNGTAQMDYDFGVIQYSLPDNDDLSIQIGASENGKYVVTMEDFYDAGAMAADTYKTFKSPKEAMAYAAKLAKRLK